MQWYSDHYVGTFSDGVYGVLEGMSHGIVREWRILVC